MAPNDEQFEMGRTVKLPVVGGGAGVVDTTVPRSAGIYLTARSNVTSGRRSLD
jgi:hypothetical protein